MGEQILADRERLLGPEHPDTLTARASLAMAKETARREISKWLTGLRPYRSGKLKCVQRSAFGGAEPHLSLKVDQHETAIRLLRRNLSTITTAEAPWIMRSDQTSGHRRSEEWAAAPTAQIGRYACYTRGSPGETATLRKIWLYPGGHRRLLLG